MPQPHLVVEPSLQVAGADTCLHRLEDPFFQPPNLTQNNCKTLGLIANRGFVRLSRSQPASLAVSCFLLHACRHTHRFLLTYITFLPFALWPLYQWVTLPIMAVMAFLLLGVENIGEQRLACSAALLQGACLL